MLDLKHIKKYYQTGDYTTKALDDVSVQFREQEFVAILGPSGSGKTTLLNVIGGLDRYDSGDLLLHGRSTKNFKEADWDAYRNNSVGFIFQSYNLIMHLSILENVELGLTLSGVSAADRRKKAEAALTKVGLKAHMGKQPNQLSGGQMQRVAIARAIVSEPSILLADEPTGALDTETSEEIMRLIADLSRERLVIMVTHNPQLAHEYAERTIEFKDGKILSDSRPFKDEEKTASFDLHRTKMSYFTALKLSFTNIMTKKGRTFLTAFASSIGIIGIAVVLALSSGFQKQIDNTQAETLAQFPITISTNATSLTAGAADNTKTSTFKTTSTVVAKQSASDKAQHTNKLNQKYIDYVNGISKKLTDNIGYTYGTGMNLLRDVNGTIKPVQFSTAKPSSNQTQRGLASASSSVYPVDREGGTSYLKKNYEVVAGSYPKHDGDVILIVDRDNSTNINALKNLGFDVKDGQKVKFNQIVGTKIKAISNNAYYQNVAGNVYVPTKDYANAYKQNDNRELTVAGVLRTRSKTSDGLLSQGFAYSDRLTKDLVALNKDSDVVKAQRASDVNIFTNQSVDKATKDQLITALGGSETPMQITIYPTSFKDKDKILSYLDKFNRGKKKADQVVYTDLAGTISSMTGGIMSAITIVLVAFAGISLVTSMIMIAILTYTSVLERTKEIGVLKALGARRKDITRVFDAETIILGVSSGILGIIIAWLLTFPINAILYSMTELPNVAQLNPIHAVILILISTILTVLGGHIPARMAANKDAAIALRAD
ncbi:ABC transporter ATP-binding protein/permease [Lacticaseibacillus paracasei]|uniref:ABC transporter ATP-binding protein/permease n=1 Tax=Lacticaseibacillus paracasei TaxID=1597 RepID=UPI001CC1223E|nr:ABC transporter ATP-binding protein/permease [Lacticaseibacillus paracasei]MBZ3798577.1 ATP-binding cassette domain-containing protein [Lacticaseibacillus paracasei]